MQSYSFFIHNYQSEYIIYYSCTNSSYDNNNNDKIGIISEKIYDFASYEIQIDIISWIWNHSKLYRIPWPFGLVGEDSDEELFVEKLIEIYFKIPSRQQDVKGLVR